MSYEKYIKYKTKYIELKNQIGGLVDFEKCDEKIFDIECLIPKLKTKEYDYLFKNRLSTEAINILRGKIQDQYSFFYNYLCNTNYDYEIHIPIIETTPDLGKIDYDIFAEKILTYMNKYKYEEKNLFTELNRKIKLYNNGDGNLNKSINEYNIHIKKYDYVKPVEPISKIITIDYLNPLNRRLNQESNTSQDKHIRARYELFNDIRDNYLYKIMIGKEDIPKFNIFNYMKYDYDNPDLFKKETIKKLIKERQKYIVEHIIKTFNENKTNAINIKIGLKVFNTDKNNITSYKQHANSLLIYKFKNNGIDSYLAIRTEPHRHSNIYCRNSIRKEIRDIASIFPNFYYIDYVIEGKYKLGIQSHEGQEAGEINSYIDANDFDNLPKEIQYYSPLQGNSGFCASWTIYTVMILLLNKDKSLINIGKYFGTFGEAFNHTINYTLKKHIKLYKTILFIIYFLHKNNINLINKLNQDDKNYLETIFKLFDSGNVLNKFNNKLDELRLINIKVDKEILQKDTHLCDDTIFDHKEFCNTTKDIIKNIDKYIKDPKLKDICRNSKLKDENDNIVLKKLDKSNDYITYDKGDNYKDKINMSSPIELVSNTLESTSEDALVKPSITLVPIQPPAAIQPPVPIQPPAATQAAKLTIPAIQAAKPTIPTTPTIPVTQAAKPTIPARQSIPTTQSIPQPIFKKPPVEQSIPQFIIEFLKSLDISIPNDRTVTFNNNSITIKFIYNNTKDINVEYSIETNKVGKNTINKENIVVSIKEGNTTKKISGSQITTISS